MAEYLQVLTGGDSKAKKVYLRGQIHPAISKSLDIIKEKFERICLRDQEILGDPQKWTKVLKSWLRSEITNLNERRFKFLPFRLQTVTQFAQLTKFFGQVVLNR